MNLSIDIVVLATLLGLAWRTLFAADLYEAIVLFICFGLFMALAWVRLRAPDVALVEAAVGSGLSGAVLLSTLGRMQRLDANRDSDPERRP
jgi:uncharacterized MnhB-related membrane protein